MSDKVPDTPQTAFEKSADGQKGPLSPQGQTVNGLYASGKENPALNSHSKSKSEPEQPRTLNEAFAGHTISAASEGGGEQTLNDTFEIRPLERTPFHEHDVEISGLKKVGMYLKKPLDNMSQGQKQVFMYGLQVSAAVFLGVAGYTMMGAGALAATVGAGYMATGGFNSVRSFLQVKARKAFATTPEKSAKTEIANSLASGGTNAPQAFMSMSPAAFAALAIYLTRSLNYSVQSDELAKKTQAADLNPKENTPFDETDVELEHSRFLDFVNENCQTTKKILMDNFVTPAYKGMVKTGHKVEKVPGGRSIMEKGPPIGMFVRAGLQAAEGITAAALAGPVAGVMVAMAGASYLAAATFMAAADSGSPEAGADAEVDADPALEDKPDNPETHSGSGDVDKKDTDINQGKPYV